MNKKDLTLFYALIQGSYWMIFCICIAYAVIYLSKLGYQNVEAGIVLATGNLLGMFLGTLLSSMIDKNPKINSKTFILPILILQLMILIILNFIQYKNIFICIIYIVFVVMVVSVGSLELKIYVDLNYLDYPINYGIARGIGSLSYVISSILLGLILNDYDIKLFPLLAIILTSLQIIFHINIFRYLKDIKRDNKQINDNISLKYFLKDNKTFCLLLIGLIFIFYAHTSVTSFMINIVTNLGGATKEVGYLNGFMALVEIPIIMSYSKIFKKHHKVLIFSFFFFSLQAFLIFLAPSINFLYFAFLFQGPSYALYAAAIVPYIEQNIDYQNSAKAQSLAFSTTTIASVLASILGGYLFDITSVHNTLLIGTIFSICGCLIAIKALKIRLN